MILAIILVTVAVSALCFRNHELLRRLALVPYLVFRRKQWERIITHGFVHGDWMHLLINMLVFWSFATHVLYLFKTGAAPAVGSPEAAFALLYFGGLIAASVYDLFRYRQDPSFSSIGASGAVSAVVFASIFYNPMGRILFFGVIPMPGIVFGILYLVYESWGTQRKGSRINHHAHLFGAIYGFIFPMLMGAGFSTFLSATGF